MTDQPEVRQEEAKPDGFKMETRTLAELGHSFPIGVEDKGQLHKQFSFKPWGFEEELAIGEARDEEKDSNIAQHARLVLGIMGDRFGPWDLTSLKDDARALRISSCFLGDVQYAYICLRIQALDNIIKLGGQCNFCKKVFKQYPADLNTLEVGTVKDVASSKWAYELRSPIRGNSREITSLLMGQPRWHALEALPPSAGLNSGAAKWAIVKGAVYGVNGVEGDLITDAELRRMVKMDIELLNDAIDEHHVGPKMLLEAKCDRCKETFRLPIDWGYESFFGTSSL